MIRKNSVLGKMLEKNTKCNDKQFEALLKYMEKQIKEMKMQDDCTAAAVTKWQLIDVLKAVRSDKDESI